VVRLPTSIDQDAKRVGIVSGIGWRKLPASLDTSPVLKKKEGDYRDVTTLLKSIGWRGHILNCELIYRREVMGIQEANNVG